MQTTENHTRQAENKTDYPQPPFPQEKINPPGLNTQMNPKPDHGENSYRGSGKLSGKRAVITGGDSGIGRAVAIAFAREGADVFISYLNEDQDAEDTADIVKKEGRKAFLFAGDISDEDHCKNLIDKAVAEMGGIDILVNNAAFQRSREGLQDIPSEEWDYTFRVNIHAMFYLCKAAEPHLAKGSSIINTTSVNAYDPSPNLLAYATTKGAIQNFTSNLAQLLGEKGIRANCIAPGPVWTPLIPATMPEEKVKNFGKKTPAGRPGQPAELAGAYVLLASDDGSYINGSTIEITGGRVTL